MTGLQVVGQTNTNPKTVNKQVPLLALHSFSFATFLYCSLHQIGSFLTTAREGNRTSLSADLSGDLHYGQTCICAIFGLPVQVIQDHERCNLLMFINKDFNIDPICSIQYLKNPYLCTFTLSLKRQCTIEKKG